VICDTVCCGGVPCANTVTVSPCNTLMEVSEPPLIVATPPVPVRASVTLYEFRVVSPPIVIAPMFADTFGNVLR
jgi:hypothetical protein